MHDRLPYALNNASDEVDRFAMRTLGILAEQYVPQAAFKPTLESYLAQMQTAVLSMERGQLDTVVQQMRTALISAAEIAECYVPDVARRLGNCWVEDTLDFRSVSVGSARLQSLLWNLEADWTRELDLPLRKRTNILVVVPESCQHTLGATVMTGQLRRLGVNAQLALDATPENLTLKMQARGFAGVMISTSGRETLESVTNLVHTARQSQATTPVLIGGNILEQMTNICDITGADLATCAIDSALAYCGVDHPQVAIAPARRSG